MFDWLQHFADWLIYAVIGISPQSHLGEALNFFVYDTIKILILLFLITFLMGIVNSYFPIDRIKNFLSRNKLYGGEYLMASTFGAVTPFCSCSSVPLFIGFVKGGIPLGVTFAFLITSPLVNEVAIAIFLGMFGVKATLVYVVSGILLGVISGAVLGKMNLEPLLTDWVRQVWKQAKADQEVFDAEKTTFVQRIPTIIKEAFGIVKSVLVYVLIGIAIGAAMHGYVPEGFFEQYIGKDTWYAVPLAVLLGIPMYANAAGIIPVIQVFVAKGIPIGTSLAFMMAVVGLSIPEATLLKKVMTTKLLLIFFGVVAACIILSGYLFNLIL
ncbi:permease [Chryseotalea sanaruensis]|uniref:Permease n=1 Tax=Chryseotalea sanaruensis TaxID=2482724 RepID=A0A401UCX6_9BACT|nr:permease [Chryseotalea sanaruensis]GCC52712.1 permease [Chryseotalea sanaruensis]